ncbi:hypothetical protein G6F57_005870 [Rhizopus arrhizus]|uniref:Yeast cell wall synthesis Kre9/Knh1-like N-terminal domain-containing protein n=1 Tax=Rhizopus oryzae TaxID=64495 RepID=A0A9P6XAM2_RHIOR|nr:hypothetical protein G6F23_006184 [Rhizopus arrhizus]KAG1420764.1 hypothetical protein G6F58_004047 [Rhizopus delemar]KAG0767712.1 hypothetical protein G6F24_002550 [Rhizopus arrhizus]KAG0789939.1 hypothetical protein G6F21_006160 [Rhizopus arrhizus]KAG0801236.1 hypothetical protein G6F22_001443 [Rhizopus arrhizus]
MVSFKTFITAALLTALAEAAVSPTYPQPGTVQIQGQSYDITWSFDGKNASETYQIDFMTGSNDNQKVLSTVAKGVSANLLKYSFTAPEVSPNSAIYFFMFTGSNGDQAWTTRFGIAANAGASLTAEPESTQPNGDKIPWGIGKLASSSSNSTSAASSAVVASASAASSAIPSAAAVSSPIAVSSAVAPSSAAASSAAASSAASSSVAAATVSSAASSAAHSPATSSSPSTSAGSIVRPALSFIAAGVAGYLML